MIPASFRLEEQVMAVAPVTTRVNVGKEEPNELVGMYRGIKRQGVDTIDTLRTGQLSTCASCLPDLKNTGGFNPPFDEGDDVFVTQDLEWDGYFHDDHGHK